MNFSFGEQIKIILKRNNMTIQDLADLVAVRKGLEGVTFYPIYVLDLAGVGYTE